MTSHATLTTTGSTRRTRLPLVLLLLQWLWQSSFLPSSFSVVAAATTTPLPLQLYGINYNSRQGPDWDPHRCKNYTQVVQDLGALSSITTRVRVLSLADCVQGSLVTKAAKTLNLQVLLGMWVSQDETVFDRELDNLKTMIVSNQIDSTTVLGITVGSETLYREEVTLNQLLAYRDEVKEMMVEAGLSDIPVSICDIDDIYLQYPDLFTEGDQVVVNSFPYWEGQAIDEAIEYLEGEMEPVFAKANGKQFILGETGWPSSGNTYDSAVPSLDNQAQYLTDFYCRMDQELGWAYFFFTGIDSTWRLEQDEEESSVEGHFGLFYDDLTLKESFQDLVIQCPGSSEEYTIQLKTAPAPAPTVSTPAPTSASVPTATIPTVAITVPTSNVVSDTPVYFSNKQTCAANSACAALELEGSCCPAAGNVYLQCCDEDGRTDATSSPTTEVMDTASPEIETTDTSAPSDDVPSRSPSVSTVLQSISDAPSAEWDTWEDEDRDAANVSDNSGASSSMQQVLAALLVGSLSLLSMMMM